MAYLSLRPPRASSLQEKGFLFALAMLSVLTRIVIEKEVCFLTLGRNFDLLE